MTPSPIDNKKKDLIRRFWLEFTMRSSRYGRDVLRTLLVSPSTRLSRAGSLPSREREIEGELGAPESVFVCPPREPGKERLGEPGGPSLHPLMCKYGQGLRLGNTRAGCRPVLLVSCVHRLFRNLSTFRKVLFRYTSPQCLWASPTTPGRHPRTHR